MKHKLLTFLRTWGIGLATLIFVGKALQDNWQDLNSIQIQNQAWVYAGAALGVGLLSHLWLALLWGWILRDLQNPVPWQWAIVVFLTNDIAKYLPGNVWHLYGRVRAAQKLGISVEVGTSSVLLEPLFITAAAMGFALLNTSHPVLQGLSGLALACILIGVHPLIFEQVLNRISSIRKSLAFQRFRRRTPVRPHRNRPLAVRLKRYPLGILGGEVLFVGLRCISFLLTVLTFTALSGKDLVPLVGGFSFAWILGLVMPGAPGGLGVFEATAINLLNGLLTPGILLGAVGLYSLINILTSIVGASVGWLIGLLMKFLVSK